MKSKAFTLIELLVVISIIGVIASIVLVSFSGSRDKAKIAKGQHFDAQISHALGAYAVGIWRFEEGAGINIHDESGYGNHGTFYGNPTPVFPDGVYSGTKALQFDGVDDYVDCDNDPSLNITDAITIEAWIYPKTLGEGNAGHIVGGINLFYTYTNNALKFINGITALSDSSAITLNQWQHVAFTYDRQYARFYVNSMPKGETELTTAMNTGNYLIGARSTTGNYTFNGTIDDVRIYSEALSVGQIQQHYAEGVAAHGIVLR